MTAETVEVERYEDGTTKSITRLCNGLLNESVDGEPARTLFWPNGQIAEVNHYKDGQRWNPSDTEPAEIGYEMDGTVAYRAFYTDDVLHDPDADTPALVIFQRGEVHKSEHYMHGVRSSM